MKSEELQEIRRAARMSPVIFFAPLLALLYLAALFLGSPKRDLPSWVLAALALGAIVALVWNRWVGPGAQWYVRAALLTILGGLGAILVSWLPRTDVFYGCTHCRAGTAWPLFALWGAGIGLPLAVLFGTDVSWARLRRPGVRSALAWLLIGAWSLACAWILARNLDAAVLWATVAGPGKALLVVAGVLLGGYLLLSLLSRGMDRKRQEAAADFERMGAEARAQVRALIERQARQGEFAYAYYPGGVATADAAGARIGGDPWRAEGEAWPRGEDGKAGMFLLQVPLDAPRLGTVWRERLATVFLVDHEIVARSHRSPTWRLQATMRMSSTSSTPMDCSSACRACRQRLGAKPNTRSCCCRCC